MLMKTGLEAETVVKTKVISRKKPSIETYFATGYVTRDRLFDTGFYR